MNFRRVPVVAIGLYCAMGWTATATQDAHGRISTSTTAGAESAPSEGYLLAQAAGVKVERADVLRRQELLRKIQGDTLPYEVVRQDLVAEVFFASHAPAAARDEELSIAWDTLSAHLPEGSRLSFQEARPLLEAQVLSGKEENRIAIERLVRSARDSDLASIIAADEKAAIDGISSPPPVRFGPDGTPLPPPPELWPIRSVQIAADPRSCLAYDTVLGACILDVARFNLEALTYRCPRSVSLDTVRWQVADKALNEARYSDLARKSGWDQRDDVRSLVGSVLSGFAGLDSRMAMASLVTDSVLRQAFREHPEVWRESEETKVRLTGSTDSVFLDSLWRAASADGTGKSERRKRAVAVPGQTVLSSLLPDLLRRIADSLPVGAVSRVVKLPYGRFFVSILEVRMIPERGFDEVRDQLRSLLLAGKIGERVRPTEVELKVRYNQYRSRYRRPDTLEMRAWLRPESRSGAAGRFDSTGRWIRSTSFALPDTTRMLLEQLREVRPRDSLFQVIDPFGLWSLRIASVRRGTGYLPFEAVRGRILAELSVRPLGWSVVPRDDRQRVLGEEALALSYWKGMVEALPRPSDQEIAKALSDHAVQVPPLPPGSPESLRQDLVADALKERRWRSDLAGWKARIVLNIPLLRG